MNSIEKEIFEMYINEKIGKMGNEYCGYCKKNSELAGPISFFHVGSNFENDQHKIVFVGKNSWYDKDGFQEDKYSEGCFADTRKVGRDSIIGYGINSPYWRYIRYITEKLYGNINDGVERIAVTNIVKCNTTGEKDDYTDKTPKDIIKNCIDSRIFEKEIEIMKPKHIIFLTGTSSSSYDYDDEIKNYNFNCSQAIDEENKRIDDGKIVWWTRKLCDEDNLKYSILRTSHPQGKHKDIFIKSITDWVKYKKSPSSML